MNDQVLTPTYTKDLAEKIKELLQTEAYGLYNITNSGECSWYGFAGKIFELLGLKPDFSPTTTAVYGAKARRPVYSMLAVGDVSFAEKSRARMNEFKEQGKTILLVTYDLVTVEIGAIKRCGLKVVEYKHWAIPEWW